MPDINRQTNDGKAEYAMFIEGLNGKTIVTKNQWKQATALRGAMNRNTAVAPCDVD
jgi:hypothetical protein